MDDAFKTWETVTTDAFQPRVTAEYRVSRSAAPHPSGFGVVLEG